MRDHDEIRAAVVLDTALAVDAAIAGDIATSEACVARILARGQLWTMFALSGWAAIYCRLLWRVDPPACPDAMFAVGISDRDGRQVDPAEASPGVVAGARFVAAVGNRDYDTAYALMRAFDEAADPEGDMFAEMVAFVFRVAVGMAAHVRAHHPGVFLAETEATAPRLFDQESS